MFGYNAAMTDEPPPGRPPRFDAAELSRVSLSADGRRVHLKLRDGDGRPASVSLPVDCLGRVLTAVPRDPGAADPALVHRLAGWSLRHGEHGLLLTFELPDGGTITFAVQPWQIAAIASLAGHDTGAGRHRPN